MTLTDWFKHPENYQELRILLNTEPLRTAIQLLKNRGLPHTSDVNPSDVAAAASGFHECAGWHNCLRTLESMASLPTASQKPVVLTQFDDDYVKRIAKTVYGKRTSPPPVPSKKNKDKIENE